MDIDITEFPVAIVSDSHMDLGNLERLRAKYKQIICLGDITSSNHPFSKGNDKSVTFFKKHGIPCLKGNHEQCIQDLKKKHVPFMYHLSETNLDYLASLPVGFRLHLPSGRNALCFHNHPNHLGGHTGSPRRFLDLFRNYPIDSDTTFVATGHEHVGFCIGYKGFLCKFLRCPALKDGGYLELQNSYSIEFKNLNFAWHPFYDEKDVPKPEDAIDVESWVDETMSSSELNGS